MKAPKHVGPRTIHNQVIHRKRLFGGRETAEEVHQRMAFPLHAKCACGARPMTRAISLAPLKEAMEKWPHFRVMAQIDPNELFKIMVQFKGSDGKPTPYIRLGVAYACKRCTPTMEREAAKGPSWVVVEFNRGPGADKPMVQVH